ncbi:hypothetical protein TNCV_4342411 [Trichonephila clavipes]|nr:hypothetical protein TNCV_4342411 [Trichonephila clavipes]
MLREMTLLNTIGKIPFIRQPAALNGNYISLGSFQRANISSTLTVGQLNLRKCYIAAFPQLKSEDARDSTFGGWPRLHVKVRELVK